MANDLPQQLRSGSTPIVDQLNEVDVDGVEPLTSIVETTLPMRDDVVTDGNIQDQVLANAPRTEHGFFVVPKAVE